MDRNLNYNSYRVMAVFQERFGFSPEEAHKLALDWLPGVLHFEPGCLEGFPNGCRLNDDTAGMDALIWTRGKCGPNPLQGNTNLLEEFPYLGAPHAVGKKKTG